MLLPDKQPIKDAREVALSMPSPAAPAVQPPAAPPAKSEIDILDSLQRRWPLALGIFIVCVGLGFRWISHHVSPTYQAETTIFVSPSALKENAERFSELSYVALINQQILTMTHYDTLNAALRRLDAGEHPWRKPGESEQAAIDRLRHTVSVARVPDTYEISISASGSDPTDLARIANAVADGYLERGRADFMSDRSSRMSVLMTDKAAVEKQLNERLETAAQYSGKLQVVDLEKAQTFPDDAVLAQMRVALAASRQKRIEAEQQLMVDEKTNAAPEAARILMNDTTTQKRLDSLLQRQSDLRTRLEGMRPANPLHQTAEKQLANVDGELQRVPAEMIRTIGSQILDKLHSDVDQSRLIEQALGNEVTEDAVNLEKTSRELHEARALNADIERLRTHLRDVQEHMDALNLQADTPTYLSIFSVAQLPLTPLKDQKRKAMGALLALALVLGLCVPVILDASDTRIHSPASVERIVGFLPLGVTVERTPGREEFAEEHLHRLATGIQRCVARGARTVLLTPLKVGLPDTFADDIANVLIARGFRPTLVHANRRGLANGLERIANRTRITALGPYGSILNSQPDGDVVLISSPPLLLSSDAEWLATEADVTLMILQAGKTTRKDLERAAKLLERLRVAGVGAILTSVRVERAGRMMKGEFKDFMTFWGSADEV